MSVIKHIVSEERDRLKSLIKNYEDKLKQYPKGSIVNKKIAGKSYSYAASRQGKKVITKYIGKSESADVKNRMIKLQERKKLEKQLREAKANYKEAERFTR